MSLDDDGGGAGRAFNEVGKRVSTDDFDVTAFLPYLDEFSLSHEQKVQFLQLVWNIMRTFVELNVPAKEWGPIVGDIIGDLDDDKPGGGPVH
jgi:hypothetical protein